MATIVGAILLLAIIGVMVWKNVSGKRMGGANQTRGKAVVTNTLVAHSSFNSSTPANTNKLEDI